MSSQDDAKVYEELIGFLKSDRDDLRIAATKAVSEVTDHQGMEKLIRHGAVEPLLKLVSVPTEAGALAAQGLVALSSQGPLAPQCVQDILDAKGLSRLVEVCLSPPMDRVKINYCLALLANCSRTEQGAIELVGTTLPEEAIIDAKNIAEPDAKPTMYLLLERFLNPTLLQLGEGVNYRAMSAEHWSSQSMDPYQHYAAILHNSTQVEGGRRFLLKRPQNDQTLLERIVSQVKESINPIRRRGIAGTIRNVCLETDSAWWLIHVVKIPKIVLYPLAGPEELDIDEKQGLDPDLWLAGPDKERDADSSTRLFCVEAILLLCASGRRSREELRKLQCYVVLKYCDMVEEEEHISERINECVQFLKRDEEGEESPLPQPLPQLPPSTSKQVGAKENNDDEDYDLVD